MLNKQPIFLNAFSRSGSNMIWEILQCHPDAVAPIHETDKIIFEDNRKYRSYKNFWLSLLGGQPFPSPVRDAGQWILNYGLFSESNYKERRLNKFAQNYLDKYFYKWKLRNLTDPFNKYKTETEIYTEEEVKNARIAAKNINGIVALTPSLIKMYPESVHFGLVRDGLALCEARLRRGTFTAEKFGIIYNKTLAAYEKYEKQYPNFHILKFEDFLNDPITFIKDMYAKAGLSYSKNAKIRLKAKKHINEKGEHTTNLVENNKYWISQEEIFQFVNPKINEIQIKRLTPQQREGFLKHSLFNMQKYGYL